MDRKTEENIRWEDIPENEKASQDDIEALDAKCEGAWDGFNHQLNKRVREAAESGNPAENLKEIRQSLSIPGPVYGVNIDEFMKANRDILFSRVEKNLLSAVYESVVVMGLDKTNDLFLKAVEKAVADRHA